MCIRDSDMLRRVGFKDVTAECATDRLIQATEEELSNLDASKGGNGLIPADTVNCLRQSWKNRLQFAKDGEHSWGLFSATK